MNAHKDLLAQLMGNPVRARVLRLLVLNEHEVFTPARLGKRAHVSARSAARELAALHAMKIARKGAAHISDATAPGTVSRKKHAAGKAETVWFLDPHSTHLRALSAFVRAVSPVEHDDVLEALKRSGKLSAVVLSGFFVGDSSRPVDVLVVGDQVNERRLEVAVKTLEHVFGRELRYAAFTTPEFRYRLTVQDRLVRDTIDFPHIVLLDRTRLL